MSEWYAVEGAMALEDGEMKQVTVAETQVLIARVEGQYFATQALCPHLRGKLAQGKLEGHVVVCPSHGSRFDVRNGRNLEWIPRLPGLTRVVAKAVRKPTDLAIHATRVEDGQLWVQL